MATVDRRAAYELLRRVLEFQSLQQQGINFNAPPNITSGEDVDNRGSPEGLPGRSRALLAEQSREDVPPQPWDPNFRQLSRMPTPNQPTVATSQYPQRDQSSPSSSSIGSGSFDTLVVPPQTLWVHEGYGNRPAIPWFAPSPSGTALSPRRPGRGTLLPLPPVGAAPPMPPISMPTVPDWWKWAEKFLQLHSRIASGVAGQGGEDKDRCLDRWEGEYNRCDVFRRPTTNRWRDACRERANARLRLCRRNGGSPDPDEPPEYWWNDIPNDPAGR